MKARPDAEQPQTDELRCSFCGTTESEAHKLIAGDEALICDRCVVQAISLLVRHATDHRAVDLDRFRAGRFSCSFCHRTSEHSNAMIGTVEARVCDRCLAGILGALAADLRERESEAVVLVMERD